MVDFINNNNNDNNNNDELNNNELQFLRDFVKKTKEKQKTSNELL